MFNRCGHAYKIHRQILCIVETQAPFQADADFTLSGAHFASWGLNL